MRSASNGDQHGSSRRVAVLIAAISVFAALPAGAAQASSWAIGDVFAGAAGSPPTYEIFANDGTFKESISKAGLTGNSTGCGFTASNDLWGTYFQSDQAVRFSSSHPHGDVQTINLPAGNHPESITFAANGDFYIGNADGDQDIYKYNAAGDLLDTFDVAVEARGSDHIDLAADQRTIFYTSEGRRIMRYDTVADAQLADFATLPGGGANFGVRVLPPGDGSGGVLVADSSEIKRLDGSGNVVANYDAPGEGLWFALNLDPNGTSFWSADLNSTNVYRFNIATGAIEVGPLGNPGQVGGLCVLGELTAGVPPPEPPPDDPDPYLANDCPGITITGTTIQGDGAPDTIVGTSGNDLLRGGGGEDNIDGIPGDDCINGQAGSDTLAGSNGDDVILAEDGNDLANGGPGNDVMTLGFEADDATGDTGNDTITGDAGADTIAGNEGNDVIKGFGNNDKITGDEDNDRVQGSGGNDNLRGNAGKDKVRGGTGQDKVNGDAGKDKVVSQGGKDKISGGRGKDNIRAGGGNDKVRAADGFADKIKCGLGDKDEATVDAEDTISGKVIGNASGPKIGDCEKVKVKT